MNDNAPSRDAQPWHEADEKPEGQRRSNAPLGTHSLTGGGAAVGMPARSEDAERSVPDPAQPEVDPLAEPRAGGGDGPLGKR